MTFEHYPIGREFGCIKIVGTRTSDGRLPCVCTKCGTEYKYNRKQLSNRRTNKSCMVCRHENRPQYRKNKIDYHRYHVDVNGNKMLSSLDIDVMTMRKYFG